MRSLFMVSKNLSVDKSRMQLEVVYRECVILEIFIQKWNIIKFVLFPPNISSF